MADGEPIPDDPPVLGEHTAPAMQADYANAFSLIHAHAVEAEEAERQLQAGKNIAHVQHETRKGVFAAFGSAMRSLKETLQTLVDYRSYLMVEFQRYKSEHEDQALTAEDLETIKGLERRHPCRKHLRQVTRKLRALGHAEEEDLKRILLLLNMALKLARLRKKPEDYLRRTIVELISNKHWKKRVEREKAEAAAREAEETAVPPAERPPDAV
jgi:hypothetical protein